MIFVGVSLATKLKGIEYRSVWVSRAVECEGYRLWRETVYHLNLKTLFYLYEMLASLGMETKYWG